MRKRRSLPASLLAVGGMLAAGCNRPDRPTTEPVTHPLPADVPSADAEQARSTPSEVASSTGRSRRVASAFAVVELFTSEGCSSCPPADENLRAIARTYEGRPVFPLSFHVDYWNRLGWADPFSDRAYSERQRRYAQALDARGVYTPQMVINGSVEFVGSQVETARRHIDTALDAEPSGIGLDVETRRKGPELVVDYRTRGPLGRHWVSIAAVDREARVSVPRGENRGRTLDHVNVVVQLVTRTEHGPAEATLSLQVPPRPTAEGIGIVGFVQDPESLRILAADGTL